MLSKHKAVWFCFLVLRCLYVLAALFLVACGGGSSSSPENSENTQPIDLKSSVKPINVSLAEDGTTQIFLGESVQSTNNLSITIADQPRHGNLIFDNNMLYTYAPNADFFGEDSFTFTVKNNAGETVQASTNITVTPVNDSPVLTSKQFTVPGNVTSNLLLDATDIENDELTFVVANSITPQSGTVNCENANCQYRPAQDFTGEDFITVTVQDEKGGKQTTNITIAVTASNIINKPYWGHYVNRETARDCSADSIEQDISNCGHAGEKIGIKLPGVTSCEQLSITDSLNAFDWQCVETSEAIHVESRGLLGDKKLSDLINLDQGVWKANFIIVSGEDFVISSAAEIWWDNPVIVLSENSAEKHRTLNKPYTIFILNNNSSETLNIKANNISLIIRDSNYWPNFGITRPTPIIQADTEQKQAFIWIESRSPLSAIEQKIQLSNLKYVVLDLSGEDFAHCRITSTTATNIKTVHNECEMSDL